MSLYILSGEKKLSIEKYKEVKQVIHDSIFQINATIRLFFIYFSGCCIVVEIKPYKQLYIIFFIYINSYRNFNSCFLAIILIYDIISLYLYRYKIARAAIYGVAQNRTRLKQLSSNSSKIAIYVCAESLSHLQLCEPHGLCPRKIPGNNIEVGCHGLLKGIFPTQELNP